MPGSTRCTRPRMMLPTRLWPLRPSPLLAHAPSSRPMVRSRNSSCSRPSSTTATRISPAPALIRTSFGIRCSDNSDADKSLARISAAAKQADGFRQRQAHHIGIGTVDVRARMFRRGPGSHSRRLCPRLRRDCDVSIDLARSAGEMHARHDHAACATRLPASRARPRSSPDGARPDSSFEAVAHLCVVLAPWAECGGRRRPPYRRREQAPAPSVPLRGNGARLLGRQTRGAWTRGCSAFCGCFVDGGGANGVGHDSGLRQQRFAPRAFARQHQQRRGFGLT